jgi:hypothetical protein
VTRLTNSFCKAFRSSNLLEEARQRHWALLSGVFVLRAVASQSAVTSAAASCRSFFPFFFSYPSTTPERIVHRSSNTYSRLRTRLTFDRCAAETALWGHTAHAADPLPTGPFPAALGKRFALSPFVNLARLERHPKMNIYRYQRTFCLTHSQPFFIFWSISVHVD